MLQTAQLTKLKSKAMRAGVWFKALHRIDRVLLDLTIRVADTVRSSSLAKSIFVVVGKLEKALETRLQRAIREVGVPIVRKLSAFAQKCGNKTAVEWAGDMDFARYWAVMKLNGHPGNG